MTKMVLVALAAAALAAPANAGHLFNLTTPYESRGACESAVADYNSDDRDILLIRFPNFFDSNGDVASYLARAFPCEKQADGNWYIQDHRAEWLASDWFGRK